jgi:hypothetical protein
MMINNCLDDKSFYPYKLLEASRHGFFPFLQAVGVGAQGVLPPACVFGARFRAAGSWCSEWLQWDALTRVLRGRASA